MLQFIPKSVGSATTRGRLLTLSVFLSLFALGGNSFGVQYTWTGGAATDNWSNAGNWTPSGGPPQNNADHATIAGSGVVSLDFGGLEVIGLLTIGATTDGTLTVVNGTTLDVLSTGGGGGGLERVRVGLTGGFGTLTIEQGAEVTTRGGGVSFQIGDESGGVGHVTVAGTIAPYKSLDILNGTLTMEPTGNSISGIGASFNSGDVSQIAANGTLAFNIDGAANGRLDLRTESSGGSPLVINGSATLAVTLLGAPEGYSLGQQWTLVSWDSSLSGQFSQGTAFVNAQGYGFSVDYAGGTGSNDIVLTLEAIHDPNAEPEDPTLSEVVARNGGSLLDGDGNSPDWIEIRNPNFSTFDISGYYLTDDPALLDKWQFPTGTVLDPLEYFVVFASDQATSTYVDAGGHLHTNFALSGDGEYLALVAPDGTTIIDEFSPGFPAIPEDASYGPDGFHRPATPRLPDSSPGVIGFVEDTKFSVDRGFFTAPFDLNITTDTTGAEIYFTTDGSPPSPTNGTLVTTAIPVSSTTVIRAAAFKIDFQPTNVDTHSYLFLSDVLTQPNTPPGLPAEWAGHPADYEMDPDVVNDPNYSADLIPALQKFPTLSIAIEPDDFYGSNGLYQKPQSSGDAYERAVSAELMLHDGSENGFQIDAGLRIQGGSSRNPDTPKHSMSLRFRKQYGAGKLNYDLFKDAPSGETAVDEFDFLQLRSGYNMGWTHRHYYQCRHAQYNRDQFANDIFLAMGSPGPHGRWVQLYINGLYWGIYHMHERPDADYMASYFGGESDDYDAINSGSATNGTKTAYNAMVAVAAGNITDPATYNTMKTHLDIDSFINYMLMNAYIGNLDWDGHNWRAAGQGPIGEPFRFFPWDSEICVSPNGSGVINNPSPLSAALTKDVTGKNSSTRPTGIHQDLKANLEYRIQFADHIQRNMFHGGPLSPEGATAIWETRSKQMDTAIVAESARWGDFRRDVEAGSQWQSSDYDLFTKNDHYLPDQTWIVDTYLQQRTGVVLNQLRNRGLYPNTDPPNFAQHGGIVPGGYALPMTNPNAGGTIYYTLNGSDPREEGGAVAAGALTYSTDVPLPGTGTVNARVLDGGEWSALQSALFIVGVPATSSNLVVSELMYNPLGADEAGEFVELMNVSQTDTIELAEVNFSEGISYTFPAGLQLAPGARTVISPSDYSGNLDNNGELITLLDALGAEIESFTYDDRAPWTESPDGEGYSLVRVAPEEKLDPNLASSWRSSTATGGNPGTSDAIPFPGGDLLAYALGPEEKIYVGINGTGDTFSLGYSRNIAADDVSYTVYVSTDLQTWNTGPGFTAVSNERLPRPDGTTDMTVSSLLPANTAPRQFLKLVVELR